MEAASTSESIRKRVLGMVHGNREISVVSDSPGCELPGHVTDSHHEAVTLSWSK